MKTTITRRFEFSAAHTTSDAICGERTHGHDFWFNVACEGQPETWGAASALIWELNGRDLNQMIIGAEPTPEGIAAWALERLRLHFPGLRSVTVGMRDIRATVEV